MYLQLHFAVFLQFVIKLNSLRSKTKSQMARELIIMQKWRG